MVLLMGNKFRRSEEACGVRTSIAACAAASALIPIHPSLQALWIEAGLPSAIGVVILLGPAVLFFLFRPVLTRYEVSIFLPFMVYATWLLATSVYSPTIGMPNWWGSVRSLAVVLPGMMLAACVAARNTRASARVVIGCGVVAAAHFSYLLLVGKAGGDEVGGFRAIAVIDGVANYQATSFYIGILGIWGLSLIKYRRSHFLLGVLALALAIALMSMSGARSALVGLLGVAVMSIGVLRIKWLIGMVLLGLVLGILGFGFLSSMENILSLGDGFQGAIVVARFTTLFEEGDSSHRLRLFAAALEMWFDSPSNLLLGGGLAAFPLFTGQPDEPGWYPHNFVLESLAEGGIVAALPLLFIMQRLFKSPLASTNLELNSYVLQYFALYTFLASMFTGGVESVWIPCFALALHFFSTGYLKNEH